MNPVQFKVSSVDNITMNKVEGMTVYSIPKSMILKNNQCFLVNRWEFKDTILTSIQSLKN